MADLFNGLMAFPNLIGLLGLSGLVVKITNEYLNEKKL
jgi:AGCS family alanine or glycine:cation symporter